MITRIHDKDGDNHWTITPKYSIGQAVEVNDNADGTYLDTIVGFEVWINLLNESFIYKLSKGSKIEERQIVGTLTRDEELRNANTKQQQLV